MNPIPSIPTTFWTGLREGIKAAKAAKAKKTGVTVKSPGPTGWGTTVTDARSGAEVHGIARIDITIEPDNINVITAEIIAHETEINGRLELILIDPASGKQKVVSQIEFADGSIWAATST